MRQRCLCHAAFQGNSGAFEARSGVSRAPSFCRKLLRCIAFLSPQGCVIPASADHLHGSVHGVRIVGTHAGVGSEAGWKEIRDRRDLNHGGRPTGRPERGLVNPFRISRRSIALGASTVALVGIGVGTVSASSAAAELPDAAVTMTIEQAVLAPQSVPTARQIALQQQAIRQAQFAFFTTHSSRTRDIQGYEPSLYRGMYFKKSVENRRKCIVIRESNGRYNAINPTRKYRGAYQVSPELARGATWMMLKEHRALMGDERAKQVLEKLRRTPMNAWPRYWQDAAFSTIHNWERTGAGASHWAGGRWHC